MSTINYAVAGLKGVNVHMSNDQISNVLEANMKLYYDWLFLKMGAWTDVQPNDSSAYGNYGRLRPVNDPQFDDGQVWEGNRKDWVWETGINYVDPTGGVNDPIITGVPQVDGSDATGTYHVDYPKGRIIFDTPISTTSVVKMQRAQRFIQVYKADDAPWWTELQYSADKLNDSNFLTFGSGEWSIGSHHRVQMPCVIVECVPGGSAKGYGVGSNELITDRNVFFHVLAENRYDRNNIMDIINFQIHKHINLIDPNILATGGEYPLNASGELVGTKMYTDLQNPISDGGYQLAPARLVDSNVGAVQQIHPHLYEATIRTNVEVIL